MSGEEEYKVGPGKPPLHTRFGQPGGNPQGMNRETQEKRRANAIKATTIREKLLDAVLARMVGKSDDQIADMVDQALNTMLKDTENRGFGMPTQQIDNTSSDGSMSAPAKIIINGVKPVAGDD